MTDVLMEVTGSRNEALAEKAKIAASQTIPGGRYKFQIENYTVQKSDREFWDDGAPNKWFGKQMIRIQAKLTSRCEEKDKQRQYQTLDKPLTFFFSVCTDEVNKADGKLSDESKLFGNMIAVAVGCTSNKETLDYFKEHMASLHVQYSPAKGEYEERNWVKGIEAIKE